MPTWPIWGCHQLCIFVGIVGCCSCGAPKGDCTPKRHVCKPHSQLQPAGAETHNSQETAIDRPASVLSSGSQELGSQRLPCCQACWTTCSLQGQQVAC